MAVRKAVDDKAARDEALRLITGQHGGLTAVAEEAGVDGIDAGRVVIAEFPAIQFETATSKVAGEELRMRRVVLTGPWQVVRD